MNYAPFYLFSFFLSSYSLFRQNLRLFLLPGNRRYRIEALTQCAEWSQFMVWSITFLTNMIFALLGALGHLTFLATAANRPTL